MLVGTNTTGNGEGTTSKNDPGQPSGVDGIDNIYRNAGNSVRRLWGGVVWWDTDRTSVTFLRSD